MFRFAHPEYLYGLYIIPFLLLLFWVLNRRRKKSFEVFANKKLHGILLPFYSKYKYLIKSSLITGAIALLILALANPQIGTKTEVVKQAGIDVYICLDVSLSMQAQDIKPSRLAKAKFDLLNLIKNLHGDRIGLIVFAAEAFIQFPLTSDYSAASLFVNAVNESSVPEQGTVISAAINLATKSFNYSSKTEKVIVVISDGGDHEGDLMQAINNAKDKGIIIYTIGLGSPDGVPIPIFNPQGRQIGFKRDRQGNIVLTKLDASTLKKIADATGGKYFQGSNYQDQLQTIYKDLNSYKKTEYGSRRVTDYENRFYYLLIPAIILLILEFFLSERKSKFLSRLNKRFGIE